ncbi:MAG TPA: type IX secretion system sortase PorU [bacterium]|jgi:hypothetical protein
MKIVAYAVAALALCASLALAGTSAVRSSAQEFVWTYSPGKPTLEQQDSINTQGVNLQWADADYLTCRNLVQPVRIFYIAVPPGTTPQLTIQSVRTTGQLRGLPGRPPVAAVRAETPSTAWARLTNLEDWRGFRLAQVTVYLQVGDASRSATLDDISLSLAFTGSPASFASQPREAASLRRIAMNGNIAATWWQDQRRALKTTPTIQSVQSAWPQFDLQRLAVTEAGLYEVRGNSVIGSSLVGRQVGSIKLFGNGGRLLPVNPDTQVDSSLKEDAIFVDDRNGNGVFEAEDRILFYGRGVKGADYCDGNADLGGKAHQSPYTTENIYFLGADPAATDGLRMAALPTTGSGATNVLASRARAYIDQDVFIFAGGNEPQSGLVWFMTTIGPSETRSFTMTLEGATGATIDTLMLALDKVSAYPARLTVWVGDTTISTNYYNDRMMLPIPRGVLNRTGSGNNVVIRLENTSSATIYVNFLEVRYERTLTAASGSAEFYAPPSQTGLFRYSVTEFDPSGYVLDVTNPLVPRIAVGNTIVDSSFVSAQHRYFAVQSAGIRTPQSRGVKPGNPNGLDYTSLRDTSNVADMIILTYDDGYTLLDSLKRFHETYREEPLRTMRVRLTDVYDEFSWGPHDAVAIRNFLKYASVMWSGQTLKYVLFVGDGDYDYRNLESAADANWMPPFELGEDCRDDSYVMFSAGSTIPSLRIGRWPVQGNSELENAMAKTIAYAVHPLYGPWKNTATFAADDEWKGGCGGGETTHTQQAEALMSTVLPQYFTFKKIYEILYPFRSSPLGSIKPDATRDLIEAINRGTLVVNFTGHGNPTVWTDEQLLVMDRDKNLLRNGRKWPFYLAATCSWGQYDRPVGRCFPEILLTDPTDGSVMSLAATRFTYPYSNQAFMVAFYDSLFRPGLAQRTSFGEAMLTAKAAHSLGTEYYHCIGDPALRLATPEFFAKVTPTSDDTLQALSLFHLDGEVSQTNGGPVWSNFRGVVDARVFDTQDSAAYYWCGNTTDTPFYYGLPGNAIFRGTATVDSGRFHVTFRVPRDVRFGGNNAKISLYFYGADNSAGADSADGIGIQEHIPIASQPSAEQDTIPPAISAWLEVPSFKPGDLVSSTPKLHVNLSDNSGLNLSGEVGHKITGRIDDAQTEDLTSFFNYDLDRYTTGSLEKVLGPLTVGEHRLIIEAWDSFNNLNQTTLTFMVGQGGEAGYAIRDVYNWPNPMKDVTHFTYFLTEDGTSRVSLKLFTLSGKLVYEMNGLGTRGPAFNSNADRPWDGRDREGHPLGNGVYFYRIKAEHTNGHSAEATGKLVILR